MELPESYKGETWLKLIEEGKSSTPPYEAEKVVKTDNSIEVQRSERKLKGRKVR